MVGVGVSVGVRVGVGVRDVGQYEMKGTSLEHLHARRVYSESNRTNYL